MKFTIEVDDFYLEEEELSDALKNHVKTQVLNEIAKSIKDKVDEHLTRKIKEEVEKNLYRMMNERIAEAISTEVIRVNGKDITISEHIKEQFVNNSNYNSPMDRLKDMAKKFGDELKNRYDLAFASHIVAKMNENGLLKDGVANLLVQNKDK